MEDTYQIRYAVVDEASGPIAALQASVSGASATSAIGETNVKALGKSAGTAAKQVDLLSKALDGLNGKRQGLIALLDPLEHIEAALADGRVAASRFGTSLNELSSARRPLQNIGDDAMRSARVFEQSAANAGKLGTQLGALGSHVGEVKNLHAGIQGFQRAAYGSFKNVQDLSGALSNLGGKAGSLAPLAKAVQGVRGSASKASAGFKRMGTSLGGLAARIGVLQAIKSQVEAIGDAIHDANNAATDGAKANLSMRDRYRELANLQGKAEPDNGVIAGALRLRVATGMNDREANDALRRFEGGLPAAISKGNITGSSTEGVAGDFFREAAQTGQRVSVSGATTGLLASKLAQTQKIDKPEQGLSQFGAIIDTLNRGDGDLDPLVKSLVQGSGGQVGEGRTFKTLGEFAAAQSVASLNASPAASSTRVRQAATALGRFNEHGAVDKEGNLDKPLAGDALDKAKIQVNDDFVTKIDKLGTIIEGAENADVALAGAGFHNQAERRSLLQLYQNRALLRKETETVRKGSDVGDVRAKNKEFFAGDLAQHKIAIAAGDVQRFAQFAQDEPVQVLREQAEASLRAKGEIDTPWSNIGDAATDNPVVRGYKVASDYVTRGTANPDHLPIGMGGKTSKQLRTDKEAERIADERLKKKGIDVKKMNPQFFGEGANTSSEERLRERARLGKENGGYGGNNKEAEQTLKQLLRETQRTNQILQGQAKPGPNPPQRFLPNVRGNDAAGQRDVKAGINASNAFF